jgi:hypothetical protein
VRGLAVNPPPAARPAPAAAAPATPSAARPAPAASSDDPGDDDAASKRFRLLEID